MIRLGPVKKTIVSLNNEPNTSNRKTININVLPSTNNSNEHRLRIQISGENWKEISKKGIISIQKNTLYCIFCGLSNIQPQSKKILEFNSIVDSFYFLHKVKSQIITKV